MDPLQSSGLGNSNIRSMRLAGMTIVSSTEEEEEDWDCMGDWEEEEEGGCFLVRIIPWSYRDNWNLARGVVAVTSIVVVVGWMVVSNCCWGKDRISPISNDNCCSSSCSVVIVSSTSTSSSSPSSSPFVCLCCSSSCSII